MAAALPIYSPDWIFKSIFFPYPGTRLAEVCKTSGLVKGVLDGSLERRKAILDLVRAAKDMEASIGISCELGRAAEKVERQMLVKK